MDPVAQLSYENALARPHLEERDHCSEPIPDDVARAAINGMTLAQAVATGRAAVIHSIRGMGRVYDLRSSTSPNGGKIHPLFGVQHIPVVPNRPGIEDFLQLRAVLHAQGLMVQKATDRDGNVCHFTNFNELCYQARGGNQQSWGVEHMHMSTGEAWTKRQLRAAAYLLVSARNNYGIPIRMARLGAGPGVVRVERTGMTSHQNVSNKAGFHDRTDPGPGFDWDYVVHAARFYDAHSHFVGA